MTKEEVTILKYKERVAFLEGKIEGLEMAIKKLKPLPLSPLTHTLTSTNDPLSPKIT